MQMSPSVGQLPPKYVCPPSMLSRSAYAQSMAHTCAGSTYEQFSYRIGSYDIVITNIY